MTKLTKGLLVSRDIPFLEYEVMRIKEESQNAGFTVDVFHYESISLQINPKLKIFTHGEEIRFTDYRFAYFGSSGIL